VAFIVVTATADILQEYCVLLEIIVVTATVDIVQSYCDVCGVDSNSRYSALVLCCVGDYCGYSNSNIVQWFCVVCGVYCGDNSSSYSAMVLCCVWRLLC